MNEDAGEFLAMLGERNSFQTFDDSKQKRPALARVFHGGLDQYASKLDRLNDQGAGVFVMVNGGDGRGRKAVNVARIRSLFVDLDGAPLAPVENAPLAPHCIVESSPGRYHAYWTVADCPPSQFKPLQQSLAARFAGDRSVCDLPRVMRIPGFWHRKSEPFLSSIIVLRKWPPRTLEEIVSGLSLSIVANEHRALPDVIVEGERNNQLFAAAQGFVRRGHAANSVGQRLATINTKRCDPPLPSTEVETIAARAIHYGSDGFTTIPDRLIDSPEFNALSPASQVIIYAAFRRFNGHNNGQLSLAWSDFAGRPGFSSQQTFYKARTAAVEAGFLTCAEEATITQSGRKPALYAIRAHWLHESASHKICGQRKPQKSHTYLDLQHLAADVPISVADTKRATR